MKRRHFLLGATATAVAGGYLLKPANQSGEYTPYFKSLNSQLQANGFSHPLMVVDAQRVRENATVIQKLAKKPIRLVVKSLPSIPLLKDISQQIQTDRFMVFHEPFMRQLVTEFPDGDFLLGKPMPINAATQFYQQLGNTESVNPSNLKLQWLIDSKQRLLEYLALAQQINQTLNINIEIDVGLHRGGVSTVEELGSMLDIIAKHVEHLTFTGFMGYDAHVGAIPSILESAETTFANMTASYRHFIDYAKANYSELWSDTLCLNGAGSPTFALHGDNSPLSEVSIGSAFVKPSDFDLPLLTALKPACFIATPVLKSMDELDLPVPSAISKAVNLYDVNTRHTFFVYGGKWMATPYAPAGLQANGLYGHSSNQEMYNAANSLGLQINDAIFFRPTQSEKVMLEFGDLAMFDENGFNRYPVLSE